MRAAAAASTAPATTYCREREKEVKEKGERGCLERKNKVRNKRAGLVDVDDVDGEGEGCEACGCA